MSEEAVVDFQDKHSLVTLGWIHVSNYMSLQRMFEHFKRFAWDDKKEPRFRFGEASHSPACILRSVLLHAASFSVLNTPHCFNVVITVFN